MLYLQELGHDISKFGFWATTLSNSLLIYLTGWKTDQIHGAYRHMIIIFACFGIVFSFVETIAQPFVHNFNGAFIYFSQAKEISDYIPVFTFLIALYACIYAMLISFVAAQFIYRFLVLTNQELLETLFKGWRVGIWVVYALSVGSLWGVLVVVCGSLDTYSMTYIKEEMARVYNTNITEMAGVVIVAYEKHLEDNIALRKSSVVFLGVTVFTLMFQYVVMVYCGCSVYWQMGEKLKNFSPSHQRLQKQIFKTLICQISVPTVLFHIPVFPVLTAPFLDMQISFQSGIIYSLFSLYPSVDSLCIMSIVSDYKIAVKKMIYTQTDEYTPVAQFQYRTSAFECPSHWTIELQRKPFIFLQSSTSFYHRNIVLPHRILIVVHFHVTVTIPTNQF